MSKTDITTIYPLLPAQEGILFHTLKEKKYNKGIYITQTIIRLGSKLNITAFWKAWEIAINRYELLRSRVEWESEERPVFSILSQVQPPTKVMNITSLSSTQQEQVFRNFLNTDLQKPFDWADPPYMRFCLFQFNDKDHRLVWSTQHIILDMANSGVTLLNEVFDIYNAIVQKQKYSLNETKSYHQVLKELQNHHPKTAMQYWQDLFVGFSNMTPLPLQSSDSDLSGPQNSCHFVISAECYQKCQVQKAKHQFTFNTFIQGAWGLLLRGYSGENDVAFGSVRAYPKEMVSNCVGLFLNTLPVRLLFDRKMTVLDYLWIIRQQQNGLRKYVTVPLYKIQEWVGQTALFNSVVDFRPTSLSKVITKGEAWHIVKEVSSSTDTNYPLAVTITDEGSFFSGRIRYAINLYTEQQIQQLIKHFIHLFEQIVSNMAVKINAITMLSEKELFLQLNQWNQTEYGFPHQIPVHKLFEKEAAKYPHKTALELGSESLTYQALNNKANLVAHELLQSSILQNEVVGIYADRGFSMMVNILGILKAGAAYLALDVGMPVKKLSYIIKNSGLKVLLVEQKYIIQLKKLVSALISQGAINYNIRIIIIESILKSMSKQENPTHFISARQLAYVIYTSGTTGKPKGVLVEHLATTNMALTHQKRLKISQESRVLQFANPAFDVSVAEWTSALISGATLCISPTVPHFVGDMLTTYLENKRISVVIFTGATLQTLPKVPLRKLKTILVGGESYSQETINYWAKDRLFINGYGLTETAVCATMYEATPNSLSHVIGKPVYNCRVYVVGRNSNFLPVGATGELYVSGLNLARAYLNNAKLTQEKFISGAFSSAKTALFKTGDLVKWLPDGNLEFVGRIDNQVKIRGFRVELDGIVQVIQQIAEVDQCAVLVNTDQLQHKILVAYIKLHENKDVTIATIKNYLKERLSSYMIPSLFVIVEQIPLTENGKIDKAYLLNHYLRLSGNHSKITEKSLEGIVVTIWKRLLHTDQIAIDENLFDLGAHSLLMLEATKKIRQRLGYPIEITTLFQYPTIRSLAEYLKSKGVQLKQAEATLT